MSLFLILFKEDKNAFNAKRSDCTGIRQSRVLVPIDWISLTLSKVRQMDRGIVLPLKKVYNS